MGRRIELARPDDWHLHLRDGAAMADAVRWTAAVFGRAVVMPNLVPPVTTVDTAEAYRDRILAALPSGSGFQPLMTLYLTDRTTPDEIARAKSSGTIVASKLYPAGATTNSDAGVTDLERIVPALEAMQALGMPLLVHGEVTEPDVDVFDREAVFVERVLAPLVERLPRLKVVLEHVTTADGVDFVRSARDGIAATVTPQHLLMNRNDLLVGGLRPHHYCLPVLKRERHRRAVLEAATSGSPRFFLGTDSAPHSRLAKQSACGCAGCFSAPVALPLYAEAFDAAGALDRFEAFASWFGADFYGLPRSTETILLVEDVVPVPEEVGFGSEVVVPLRAGQAVRWRVQVPAVE
jgi:dihydroorotase